MSVRADLVKMGRITKMDRPGLAKPFMVPAKLKDQVRATPLTDLQFDPRTVGNDVQWRISVKRPGLAQPLITAKDEKVSSEEVVAAMAAKTSPTAAAAAAEVAEANANNAENGGGVAGFFAGWGRRRRR